MKPLLAWVRIGFVFALALACAPAAPTAQPPAPTSAPASAPTQAPTSAPTQAAAAKAQPTAASRPLEKVSLRLDWLVVGYHAGFYIALQKGWYKDAGLDVTIGEGKGSGSTVQLVATGGDTFGFATAGVMAQAVTQGGPVMMVANVFPKGASAVAVREDSDIRTLKDLEGKSFGTAPSGSTYQLLPGLLRRNGVDPNKVTMVSVESATRLQLWLNRKYDAMGMTVNDDAPVLQAQGVKYRAFLYGDHGLAVLGHGIVVNTKTVQEKPDVVKGFVEAALKGWKFALENPEEAARILRETVPDTKLEPAIIVGQIKESLPLVQTDNTRGKPLGWMAELDWQNTLDLLSQYGDLKAKPALDKLYTNRFIPGS